MPSPFAAALLRADQDLDAHLGGTVQVTPMRSGDFARMPDPERPAFDVVALVVAGESSSAQVPKLESRYVAERWTVEIRRVLVAGRRIGKGDELVLLDEPGSPRVVVDHVEPGDPGRVVLVCGPISD